ncbi:NAD(P)/FAD-dependent oxidoreductase [uncultured Nocardioides sp.]|uniref:flavin-containing monooxygenase n=1 Tax=uncultured Nocardioides sp. TaxID=198441 RepID=UPI002613E9D7|nr:NAD(P)/FAD-dependent oxidoreductase [uncultured Nocardioides sp.]
MDDKYDVIVVGAGQAGLATAYHLRELGLRFLVVDSAPAVGHSWRTRWDSLRLFTPAEHDGLPGFPFPAPAGTHPTKDEVADYLAAYAERFALPVRLDTAVIRLEAATGGYVLHTADGPLRARQVVVAAGPFHQPVVPALARDLCLEVVQLHSSTYRRPADIGPGPVLVVGGGNSGRQIALELAATHDVTLSVGTDSVELPQRLLGRDLFWWLTRFGVITRTPDSFLARRMRARGDLVIGTSLEQLRRAGVTIRRRATGVTGREVRFAVGASVRPATVVWATGYRSDHGWIDVPGAVRDGRVVHDRGISTAPGLAFVGLPWQHTRGSALLGFVADDAQYVAHHVAHHVHDHTHSTHTTHSSEDLFT